MNWRTPKIALTALCVVPCCSVLAPPALAAPLVSEGMLYDNTGNPADAYYTGQGGEEAIDDLHLVSGGSLDSLVFEYVEPASNGAFSATVRIYDNPGGADTGITPLAGPYIVNGLAAGRHLVALDLPDAPVVGADCWVGVQFSSTTAGLVVNDSPAVGSSHDLYLENGILYWFGGAPKANFALRLIKGFTPLGVAPREAASVSLAPGSPNPFRGGSTFHFAIRRPGHVRLEVLDLSGRHVHSLVNGVLAAGDHTARWSGHDDAGRRVEAGIYYVRLEVAGSVAARSVVFLP